jgi:hypothetical protein
MARSRRCSGSSKIRTSIDDDGQKDKPFNAQTDTPVNWNSPGATPIRLPDGTLNRNAYNCHSYAWENSQGDPTDPRNADLVRAGITKWDNNPDNNMGGYYQLGSDDPNRVGDRVIYYVDANGNGQYDPGEEIEHSAIVAGTDSEGNTTLVIAKMGQAGVGINHPNAPGYYNTADMTPGGTPTRHTYFRAGTGAPPVPQTESPTLNQTIPEQPLQQFNPQ